LLGTHCKIGLIGVSDLLYHKPPIIGHLKDIQPLFFVLVNGTEKERLWDEIVREWHYLGYKDMIGPRVKYLVYAHDAVIAAISYNRASLRVGVRDSWLGWTEEARRKLLPHVVSNNRFLILPWVRIKNLASHILARSLRQLVHDWFRLYGVWPYAVETFVDRSRYPGTCYIAANWRYLGETRGFGKVGKTFIYHGNRKGVFVYLLSHKLFQLISQYPKKPDPKFERTGIWKMMLSMPDWSPDLFDMVGLNESSVTELWTELCQYLDYYSECFSREAQQMNNETYVKGLLSKLPAKSIEPIALRYRDAKAVRTMQQFLKNAPWNDALMKEKYQSRVLAGIVDSEGMVTVDSSEHVKKGTRSAGVARQYCGRLGKVENCQSGVYIGYSGKGGYGLLDSRLYLPEKWFDEERKMLWESCDIPETTEFQTKTQMALEMIHGLEMNHDLKFKWVGCDSAFGCDAEFRKALPESVYFFANIRSNQRVFLERPNWDIPEQKKSRKTPPKPVPSVPSVPVSSIAEDDSLPWEEIKLMDGAKGPVYAPIKYCRVIETRDGIDGDELWLYIRKFENGQIRYALSNAPADIDAASLHHAAILRWPIEQCFQECKGSLGMSDYETRSYVAWHRHMLLVMVAYQFVLEVRMKYQKKTTSEELTRY